MFLADQRGARKLQGVLTERNLSLRTAASRERVDLEAKQVLRFKLEDMQREETKQKEREEKSMKDIDLLFSKVPLGPDNIEDESDEGETVGEDEEDCDSEWEDVNDRNVEIDKDKRKYNNMSLKQFSRECDRYRISDRAGAQIGNGLLKDLGIVRKGCTAKLICPSKLRRERLKWGEKLEQSHSLVKLPQGLYTDGKRVPTLVRDTTITKVQIPGRTGRAAYRSVSKTSNRLTIEDHYPIVSEPGGEYVTHITPTDGTGLSLAKEIVSVIQERKASIR